MPPCPVRSGPDFLGAYLDYIQPKQLPLLQKTVKFPKLPFPDASLEVSLPVQAGPAIPQDVPIGFPPYESPSTRPSGELLARRKAELEDTGKSPTNETIHICFPHAPPGSSTNHLHHCYLGASHLQRRRFLTSAGIMAGLEVLFRDLPIGLAYLLDRRVLQPGNLTFRPTIYETRAMRQHRYVALLVYHETAQYWTALLIDQRRQTVMFFDAFESAREQRFRAVCRAFRATFGQSYPGTAFWLAAVPMLPEEAAHTCALIPLASVDVALRLGSSSLDPVIAEASLTNKTVEGMPSRGDPGLCWIDWTLGLPFDPAKGTEQHGAQVRWWARSIFWAELGNDIRWPISDGSDEDLRQREPELFPAPEPVMAGSAGSVNAP